MPRHSRHVLAALLGCASLITLPGLALAQAWPAKPIRVIVPYPPGRSEEHTSELQSH